MTVRIDNQQKTMFDQKATQAIQNIRNDAQNRPELTLEEINTEINSAREERQKTL